MNIDWEEQWALHALNYKNGFAHVEVHGKTYRLKPGPGFGDLSHPTTRLMLSSIPKKISLPVVDIGCGSGVLSLAAFYAGAPKVYGIDIDKASITHAKENGKLNQAPIFFGNKLPILNKPCLILMNMISSEQKIAWESHPQLHSLSKMLIISGVPEEERDRFLKHSSYGTCVEEKNLDGWHSFKYRRI